MPSLQARLHERKIHPERRERARIFINSIVHDRYNELCEIFGLEYQNKEENRERLHKEVKKLINFLEKKETTLFGVEITYGTQDEMKKSNNPLVLLGWAKYKNTAQEQKIKDTIKKDILIEKGSNIKRTILDVLLGRKKPEIIIEDSQIDEEYQESILPHILGISSEGENILSKYLESKGDNLEKLRQRTKQKQREIFSEY